MTTIKQMQADFYVAVDGKDDNNGTQEYPFATLERAKLALREQKLVKKAGAFLVYVRGGTYYLQAPLTFSSWDSGTKEQPVVYAAYPGEKVRVSGGRKLETSWIPHENGILKCGLPELKLENLTFNQLFANGKRQILARFPNFDPSKPGISGYIILLMS